MHAHAHAHAHAHVHAYVHVCMHIACAFHELHHETHTHAHTPIMREPRPPFQRYPFKLEEPTNFAGPKLLSGRQHLVRLARARRPGPLGPRRSEELLSRHTRDWARRRKHRRHPQARC